MCCLVWIRAPHLAASDLSTCALRARSRMCLRSSRRPESRAIVILPPAARAPAARQEPRCRRRRAAPQHQRGHPAARGGPAAREKTCRSWRLSRALGRQVRRLSGWEEELGAIRAVPTRGSRYEAPCSALTVLPRALFPRPVSAPCSRALLARLSSPGLALLLSRSSPRGSSSEARHSHIREPQ